MSWTCALCGGEHDDLPTVSRCAESRRSPTSCLGTERRGGLRVSVALRSRMIDDSRAARARRRASWQGELVTQQTPAQLPTPQARLASMWGLALDAFGAEHAEDLVDRADWPGRLVRR